MAVRGMGARARFAVTAAAIAGGLVTFAGGCDDDDGHATAADASADGATTITDGNVYETIPTGNVKGTIVYDGAKRGAVVIAFLSHIPGAPGAPPGPPTAGGFALANPSTYPGTYGAKVAPGTWVVSAYMTTGQPPRLDGPRLSEAGVPTEPIDPRQPSPTVVVEVDKESTADIVLIDIPDGPPPGDAGDAGDASDQ